MNNTAHPAVSLEGVSFSYSKNERVLQDVNLRMPQGDFMAVLGPNGGGKTTLLKLMLGLLEPDRGEVRIFGLPPRQARSCIGYVPQFSTLNTAFPASVMDTALMGAARQSPLRGVTWPTGRKARAAASALLSQLGLGGLENRNICDLSGGQRQRLMVARALMGKEAAGERPFLLILDEPTANIDPEGKCCFYDFLRTADRDVSIIVVSHDLALAAANDASSGVLATDENAAGRSFNSIAVVNRTLTHSSEMGMSREILRAFFGQHDETCLINNMISGMIRNVAGQPPDAGTGA